MNILVFVVSGGTQYSEQYAKMETIWRSYMNTYSNIRSFFMKLRPDLQQELVVEGDTIWIRGEESLVPGIMIKTIQCIKYALAGHLGEFDYVVRTNTSSVFNLPLLYKRLTERSGQIDYYGAFIQKWIEGSGTVLSRRACEYLVKHTDLQSTQFDDVLMGQILIPQFGYTHHPKRDVLKYKDLNGLKEEELDKYFHYRCKSSQHTETVDIMKSVLARITKHNNDAFLHNTPIGTQ